MPGGHATNDPSDYFAIGEQAAKGTEATTFTFLRHLDGTAIEYDHQIESVHEGGDGQEVGLRYQTAFNPDGQAVNNARPEVAARLFSWGIGVGSVLAQAPSAPGGIASGCQLFGAFPAATPNYLTVEQKFADTIDRVSDVVIDGLTIEGEAGRPLKITTTLVGGGTPYQRDVASVLTATRETGNPFFFPGGTALLDGAGNTEITKFKVDVKRGVDKDIRTTSIFREDALTLDLSVDCEFTLKYTDRTLYNKAHYGGGSVVPVDLATGSFHFLSAFGSGTTARYLDIAVPFMHYTGAKVNKLDPDGKTMYVDVAAAGFRIGTGTQASIYTRVIAASGGVGLP